MNHFTRSILVFSKDKFKTRPSIFLKSSRGTIVKRNSDLLKLFQPITAILIVAQYILRLVEKLKGRNFVVALYDCVQRYDGTTEGN